MQFGHVSVCTPAVVYHFFVIIYESNFFFFFFFFFRHVCVFSVPRTFEYGYMNTCVVLMSCLLNVLFYTLIFVLVQCS